MLYQKKGMCGGLVPKEVVPNLRFKLKLGSILRRKDKKLLLLKQQVEMINKQLLKLTQKEMWFCLPKVLVRHMAHILQLQATRFPVKTLYCMRKAMVLHTVYTPVGKPK